jgi:hypothetical protein
LHLSPNIRVVPNWTTGDYRARVGSVLIGDGRCFHCNESLVSFDPGNNGPASKLPLIAAPLNVDHAIPFSANGPNQLTNYVPACESCNKSRKDKLLSGADMARAKSLWDATDVAVIAATARVLDAYSTRVVIPAIRCRSHLWHLKDSPAMQDCHRRVASHLGSIQLNQEWLAVFGDISRSAYSLLSRSNIWQNTDELNALTIAIPRVLCLRPEDITSLLASHSSYSQINSISRHRYNIYPDANLDLSWTARAARDSAQVTSQARATHQEFSNHTGIKWYAIIKLFTERQWGTQILYFYAAKIKKLDKVQRASLLKELDLITERGTVEGRFSELA